MNDSVRKGNHPLYTFAIIEVRFASHQLSYSLNQFVLKQLHFEFKKENKPINDVSKYNELKFDNCEDTNTFV